MAVATGRQKHDTTVSMRMPKETKELIENAARKVGKSFSGFVIESAREQATDVMLNQIVFNLSDEQAQVFARLLDSPPAPTAKLKELMRHRSPWE